MGYDEAIWLALNSYRPSPLTNASASKSRAGRPTSARYGGDVLPEQFWRLLEQAEDESSELQYSTFAHDLFPADILENVRAVRRLAGLMAIARRHPFRAKYHARSWPQTLTGDAWRTAWAETHDAATDKALDAIY